MPFNVAEDKILATTKKALGLPDDYEPFDHEIVMHINSVFSKLFQLGVGPQTDSFALETGDEKWTDFFGTDKNLNMVKTYMHQSVRLIWDPPQNSFGLEALKEQIRESEWRLTHYAEGITHPWVPTPIVQIES